MKFYLIWQFQPDRRIVCQFLLQKYVYCLIPRWFLTDELLNVFQTLHNKDSETRFRRIVFHRTMVTVFELPLLTNSLCGSRTFGCTLFTQIFLEHRALVT